MKGIAITLATRADSEAVAAIEKLTGQKIARAGAPAKEEPKVKPAEPKPAQKKPAPEKAKERSPVVEDMSPDWNGPLPSFLSVSAD